MSIFNTVSFTNISFFLLETISIFIYYHLESVLVLKPKVIKLERAESKELCTCHMDDADVIDHGDDYGGGDDVHDGDDEQSKTWHML